MQGRYISYAFRHTTLVHGVVIDVTTKGRKTLILFKLLLWVIYTFTLGTFTFSGIGFLYFKSKKQVEQRL